MARIPFPWFVGIGMVVVGSCGVEEPTLGSTAGESFEQFEARAVREPGTGAYVVDMDTVIHSKAALRQFFSQFESGALAIYTKAGADVKWPSAQVRNLTYCVSNAFGANKTQVVNAMRAASDTGWEKFADVNFIYVPEQDATCTAQNTAVVFDVNPITNVPYLARSFFPDSPRAERNVLINSTAYNRPDFTGILGHELGHTLGFRHEHIRPEAANVNENCIESQDFRGLTPYDSASIMHYPQCNGTAAQLAFTIRDQQGVALVYGPPQTNVAPMAQLTAPANGAVVASSFVVEAQVVDTDLAKAELLIDGALGQTLAAPPFAFQVTGLATGAHNLQIRATDNAGQTGTQTISITVAAATANTAVDNASGDVTGGCSVGGPNAASAGLAIAALLVPGLRRRRRCP